MGTLTSTLNLSSTDITSDTLSISLTNILNVKATRFFRRQVFSAEDELFTDGGIVLAAASYTKSYVFFHNTSSDVTEVIHLGLTDNDNVADNALETTNIILGAGQFAFYPWSSTTDIVADAVTGSPVLEVGVFEELI
tara:strand:- start:568 stop:978 length:411 start_codon:yes stop_codon:yes gene_type:complete